MMPNGIESLMGQYEARATEVRAANIKRQERIESIFDEIIGRYGPEGTYGRAAEALLAKQKVRDVGAVAQRDISRGLYGIRPYEAEWEAEVGAPARLRLEDIKMERLSQAQLGKAGFIERIEEPYPDYGALMQAAQAEGGMVGGRGAAVGGGIGGARRGGAGESALAQRWQAEAEAFRAGGARGLGLAKARPATKGPVRELGYKAEVAKMIGRTTDPELRGQMERETFGPEGGYQDYLGTMKRTQPGAVTATPQEYGTIQQRLKQKYPQYRKPVTGAAAAYRPQAGYGTFGR